MSRKCPACKKWLATGQYVCKCGAGEQKVTVSPDDQKKLERMIAALKDNMPVAWSWHRYGANDSTEKREQDRANALEAILNFLNSKPGLLQHAANSDKGGLIGVAIVFDSAPLLKALLPHVTSKETVRDPYNQFTPAVLAGYLLREQCMRILLEDSKEWSMMKDQKTGMTPLEFMVDQVRERNTNYYGGYNTSVGGHFLNLGDLISRKDFDAQKNENEREEEEEYRHRMLLDYDHDYMAWMSPDERRRNRTYESHRLAIITMLEQASGVRSSLSGEAGMQLRAQRNAGSETNHILAPAPFIRSVWVMIVARCDIETREVILPRVCRFFRALSLPLDRTRAVAQWLKLSDKSVAIFSNINAVLLYKIGQRNSKGSIERIEFICKCLPQIMSRDDFREEVKFLVRARFASLDPHGTVRLCFVGENTVTDVIPTDFNKLGDHIQKYGGVAICFEQNTPHSGEYVYKLTLLDSETRVKFRVRSRFIGTDEGGSEGLKRLKDGVEASMKMLHLKGDEQTFTRIMSLAFGQHNYLQPSNVLYALRDVLLGSTAAMKVSITSASDLSLSSDVSLEKGEQYSVLQVLQWRTEALASFLEKHGFNDCAAYVRGNEKCNGRTFVEGNMRHLIPPTKNVQETSKLCDQLLELKRKVLSGQ